MGKLDPDKVNAEFRVMELLNNDCMIGMFKEFMSYMVNVDKKIDNIQLQITGKGKGSYFACCLAILSLSVVSG